MISPAAGDVCHLHVVKLLTCMQQLCEIQDWLQQKKNENSTLPSLCTVISLSQSCQLSWAGVSDGICRAYCNGCRQPRKLSISERSANTHQRRATLQRPQSTLVLMNSFSGLLLQLLCDPLAGQDSSSFMLLGHLLPCELSGSCLPSSTVCWLMLVASRLTGPSSQTGCKKG